MHTYDRTHHDTFAVSERIIRYGILLTFAVFGLKMVGGYFTDSLALISDGWHLAGDLVTLLLSWWGVKQSVKPATRRHSFGMYRVEILTAFLANLIFMAVGLFIVYEGYLQFRHPHPVAGAWMFAITLLGLVIYSALTYLMGKEKDNMNAKSAWLHFLGDALSSVAVLIGAAVIYFTGWYPIDGLLSALIGLVIALAAAKMAWDGAKILLEAAPSHINPEEVEKSLRRLPEVTGVTDLHIWALTQNQIMMSCHLAVTVTTIEQGEDVIRTVQDLMWNRFGIGHTTIQLETQSCNTCFHHEVQLDHCHTCPTATCSTKGFSPST
ncbi:cation diffusion facilitator family transporter [Effusibacillus pohliae]|uniref:cation diffusion facilitator family transporter n=1 Tax=Effusibacillus pohliae TaxID=232270 RepID=UPI000373E86B|nr:cation diffusion facilitator family transporter [Effusibacillus pohliae]